MRQLKWSDFARYNRTSIFDYIAERDLEAARNLDNKIRDSARKLIDFPYLGPIGKIGGTRELLVSKHYYLVYTVERTIINIVAVLNTAQDIRLIIPFLD